MRPADTTDVTPALMRRFGVIGDVHAEDELLAAALEHLAGERVDRILCTGDIVDGRGDVDRCVELLQRHAVATVRGNHDRWCLAREMRDFRHSTSLDSLAPETQAYLAQLPPTRRFSTVAGVLCLAHAIGRDDMTFINGGEDLRHQIDTSLRTKIRAQKHLEIAHNTRIHVGGHTHTRWVERCGRLTWINAGTLKGSDLPCFAVVDLDAGEVQWYDLDEDGRVMVSERVPLRLDLVSVASPSRRRGDA